MITGVTTLIEFSLVTTTHGNRATLTKLQQDGDAKRYVALDRCRCWNSECTNSEPIPHFEYHEGRPFASPDRAEARCVWLGYVEYAARNDYGM